MNPIRFGLILLAIPALASAQGSGALSGVVRGADRQPIPGVEVAIVELSRNTFTDEAGAFALKDIAPGLRVVTVRRIGFAIQTDTIAFGADFNLEVSYVLVRVPTLDTVVVMDRAMLDFEENRRLGLGRFLTRADIDQLQGRAIGNRLSEISGVGIVRGAQHQAWILTSRPRTASTGVWCPGSGDMQVDVPRQCGCYAKVYLNRMLMNPPVLQRRGHRATPPFDVNSILTMSIEAIEWYTGIQTPMRYQAIGAECGVLVIHTRRKV